MVSRHKHFMDNVNTLCTLNECQKAAFGDGNSNIKNPSSRQLPEDLTLCSECCYDDNNVQLCGAKQQDNKTTQCFNCKDVISEAVCNAITDCEMSTHMCIVQRNTKSTHQNSYSLGCVGRRQCGLLLELRQSVDGVVDEKTKCCDGHLCNGNPHIPKLNKTAIAANFSCPPDIVRPTSASTSSTRKVSTTTSQNQPLSSPVTASMPSTQASTSQSASTKSSTQPSTLPTAAATASMPSTQASSKFSTQSSVIPTSALTSATDAPVSTTTASIAAIVTDTPNMIASTSKSAVTNFSTLAPSLSSDASSTSSSILISRSFPSSTATPSQGTSVPVSVTAARTLNPTTPFATVSPSFTSASIPINSNPSPSFASTSPTDVLTSSSATSTSPSAAASLQTSPPKSSSTIYVTAPVVTTTSTLAPISVTDAPIKSTASASTGTSIPVQTSSASKISTTLQTTEASTVAVNKASTEPPPKTIPPVSTTCEVCSGPEFLCEMLHAPTECAPPDNYCINTITSHQDGTRDVVRKCGNFDTCYREWFQGSSDNDRCRKFNEDEVQHNDFQCTFCCVKDNCNLPLRPSADTLYKPA